jgi:DNA ligase-1
MKTARITKITKISSEDRYDLEVEDNHNFFANNILVHNCRCVATYDGERVRLTTRKGEEYISIPHIANDLEKFFADYPEAVLDGELFSYDYRQKLNELMSIVRKTKKITDADLKKSEEMVRFYVYDGYDFGPATDVCVKYSNRKKRIDELLPQYSKYYRKVDTTLVHSQKELDELYNKFLDDGEEGAIVRIPSSPYENKRSKYLLKYKPEDDAEATIVDIIEGTGNWSGTAKTCTLEWNGKKFDATFKGTYEQAVDRLKHKKDWIGKTVTFLYTGLTGLGVPNYARIDPDNCFKGDR